MAKSKIADIVIKEAIIYCALDTHPLFDLCKKYGVDMTLTADRMVLIKEAKK